MRKPKYRIVKKYMDDGKQRFFIQTRWFWLWTDYDPEGHTKEDAERIILNWKKNEKPEIVAEY